MVPPWKHRPPGRPQGRWRSPVPLADAV